MIMILEREDEAPGNGMAAAAAAGTAGAPVVGTVGAAAAGVTDAQLVLPFDLRSRSRFRAHLDSGEEVGVILRRGRVLRGGDRLRAEDGRLIRVAAAPETVSTAHAADADQLARGAYHLGNRHVALQVGALWLRYAHDHVLDDMVRGLGLRVVVEEAPFEPEAGAYHGHEHGHEHGHGTAHDHGTARDLGAAQGHDAEPAHGEEPGHAAEQGHHHAHTHDH